jgi:hypothetical protein
MLNKDYELQKGRFLTWELFQLLKKSIPSPSSFFLHRFKHGLRLFDGSKLKEITT